MTPLDTSACALRAPRLIDSARGLLGMAAIIGTSTLLLSVGAIARAGRRASPMLAWLQRADDR